MHFRVAVLLAALRGTDASIPVTTDLANVYAAVLESEFSYHSFHIASTLGFLRPIKIRGRCAHLYFVEFLPCALYAVSSEVFPNGSKPTAPYVADTHTPDLAGFRGFVPCSNGFVLFLGILRLHRLLLTRVHEDVSDHTEKDIFHSAFRLFCNFVANRDQVS